LKPAHVSFDGSTLRTMSFQVGQTIVHRDIHRDGRILSAGAARVVVDNASGVLTWIAEGSQVMWQTTLTGERTRKLPVDELARVPTMLAPHQWTGTNVLAFVPPNTSYSILWFFDTDGAFFGWYVNLETPSHQWSGGLDRWDLALDIWVEPDRSWVWKDEDEFIERTGHPDYWTEEEAAAIRSEGERVIALIEAGAFPFNGSLTDFEPEPGWEPSKLPPIWDLPVSDHLPVIGAGTTFQ
jgi:protein associated with RNAse G/E